jgi:hypothetical protein
MATSPPEDGTSGTSTAVTAVAAMAVEARPLRRRLAGNPTVRVQQGGIALSRWTDASHQLLISCGLAGALASDVSTGTVVIPDVVALGSGERRRCDEDAVASLRDAAARCGVTAHTGAVVTADHVVAGAERALWAVRGYVAVDMESALLAQRAPRFAVVRVILDTPVRELSAAWARPGRAIATPWLWGEALWLARVAPRLCDLVARIVAEAFSPTRSGQVRDTSGPPARPAV